MLLRLLVLALLLPFAAPAAAQRSVDQLEDLLLEKRDAAEAELFDELSSHGTEDALKAFGKVLKKLRKQDSVIAALRSLHHFGGGEAEAGAIELLVTQTGKAKGDAAKVAAAETLVAVGEGALDALHQLLQDHKSPGVRTAACDALVHWLGARGSLEGVLLILANASLTAEKDRAYLGVPRSMRDQYAGKTHTEVITAVLSARTGAEFTEAYVDHAMSRGTPSPWRRVLVDVLSPREGPSVTKALRALLDERDAGVVLAALEALDPRQDWADHDDALKPLLGSKSANVRRAAVLRMGKFGISDERWRKEVIKLSKSKDQATRIGVAASLAELRTPEAVHALHQLLRDGAWPVRVEALKAAGQLRSKETIPVLIERLDLERGRLKDDVYLALRILTGEDYGRLSTRWKAWWEGESERFELPSFDEAARRENERRDGGDLGYVAPEFYGIHVTSERVSFVLDMSGSMTEPAKRRRPRSGTSSLPPGGEMTTRIEVVKDEALAALKGLPIDVFFNIIFFETEVRAYSKQLARLKPAVRRKAMQFVRDQWAQGATALYPALQTAFADPIVDTIYVLSDGHPTHGDLTDYEEIREEVKRWNVTRNVKIHGIAIGIESPLLEWLAEDTGGEYRHVK